MEQWLNGLKLFIPAFYLFHFFINVIFIGISQYQLDRSKPL